MRSRRSGCGQSNSIFQPSKVTEFSCTCMLTVELETEPVFPGERAYWGQPTVGHLLHFSISLPALIGGNLQPVPTEIHAAPAA